MRDRIFLWPSVVFLSTLSFLSRVFYTFVVSPFVGAKRLLSICARAIVAKFRGGALGLSFVSFISTAKSAGLGAQRPERPLITGSWRLCSSV